MQVLNVIPIKGGAPPKFAQRTQLITDNYQVVWQVFICYWVMSIKKWISSFLPFLYLILSKSEICDAGLVIFTGMNPILLNLGCLCGFFLVPTFSVVVYVRLILHSNSVKSRFCESIFCYTECYKPKQFCWVHLQIFILQIIVPSSFVQLCPKFESLSVAADILWVRLN